MLHEDQAAADNSLPNHLLDYLKITYRFLGVGIMPEAMVLLNSGKNECVSKWTDRSGQTTAPLRKKATQ